MKRIPIFALMLTVALCSSPLSAQINKPIYISLPGPGNIQHLAYVAAKEKKFYDEMGLTQRQHRRAARQCNERSGAAFG